MYFGEKGVTPTTIPGPLRVFCTLCILVYLLSPDLTVTHSRRGCRECGDMSMLNYVLLCGRVSRSTR